MQDDPDFSVQAATICGSFCRAGTIPSDVDIFIIAEKYPTKIDVSKYFVEIPEKYHLGVDVIARSSEEIAIDLASTSWWGTCLRTMLALLNIAVLNTRLVKTLELGAQDFVKKNDYLVLTGEKVAKKVRNWSDKFSNNSGINRALRELPDDVAQMIIDLLWEKAIQRLARKNTAQVDKEQLLVRKKIDENGGGLTLGVLYEKSEFSRLNSGGRNYDGQQFNPPFTRFDRYFFEASLVNLVISELTSALNGRFTAFGKNEFCKPESPSGQLLLGLLTKWAIENSGTTQIVTEYLCLDLPNTYQEWEILGEKMLTEYYYFEGMFILPTLADRFRAGLSH